MKTKSLRTGADAATAAAVEPDPAVELAREYQAAIVIISSRRTPERNAPSCLRRYISLSPAIWGTFGILPSQPNHHA